jgi:mRNA interferase MazF
VVLPEGSGVIGVVLADQLKSLDWRARKAKLIEQASSEVLTMVTARILPLLVPDNAATHQHGYTPDPPPQIHFAL